MWTKRKIYCFIASKLVFCCMNCATIERRRKGDREKNVIGLCLNAQIESRKTRRKNRKKKEEFKKTIVKENSYKKAMAKERRKIIQQWSFVLAQLRGEEKDWRKKMPQRRMNISWEHDHGTTFEWVCSCFLVHDSCHVFQESHFEKSRPAKWYFTLWSCWKLSTDHFDDLRLNNQRVSLGRKFN